MQVDASHLSTAPSCIGALKCALTAEQHGIQQVRFGLDRKLGDRAGFRRNEQMLSLKPRYVIAFQGNGVTERLVIDAKKVGIRVVDRRGPLGTPPSARNAQADRGVA